MVCSFRCQFSLSLKWESHFAHPCPWAWQSCCAWCHPAGEISSLMILMTSFTIWKLILWKGETQHRDITNPAGWGLTCLKRFLFFIFIILATGKVSSNAPYCLFQLCPSKFMKRIKQFLLEASNVAYALPVMLMLSQVSLRYVHCCTTSPSAMRKQQSWTASSTSWRSWNSWGSRPSRHRILKQSPIQKK